MKVVSGLISLGTMVYAFYLFHNNDIVAAFFYLITALIWVVMDLGVDIREKRGE